ncbi:MAG: glycosyltransferase [Candidatus Omnitrophica bacterium]|nr:glycosyltransferase [Candidatus Omnitrophota bacterium]
MVSIIVRAKNEEKWITSCLESIFMQKNKDLEVIVVDNCSQDKTVEKASKFPLKIITIEDFFPGKAINAGVKQSRGEFIVCISAHCIPINESWLDTLLSNFKDPDVAGVYGRQAPMSFSSDLDKRDLINLFGLDKRIQVKDSFFHNANSMIRRSVWEKIPFDEKVTNIEDRVWAKEVLDKGYKIIYEPEAAVYHYHGVYHPDDTFRAKKTVKILESLQFNEHSLSPVKGLNVIALIPATGKLKQYNGRPLMEFTINSAKKSRYINKVIVTTDSKEYKEVAESFGASVPFLRPKELSYDFVELSKVYKFSLEKLKTLSVSPDLVVLLEETFPFRPEGLIDKMIESLVCGDYDTVFAAWPEFKSCWMRQRGKMIEIDKGFMPTKFKDPVYISHLGIGCVTHPSLIYEEKKIGDKVGIIEIDNSYSCIEIKTDDDLNFFKDTLDNFLNEKILTKEEV